MINLRASLVRTYEKLPVRIKAIVWTGENGIAISDFIKNQMLSNNTEEELLIGTLEGTMKASKSDFIIEGVNGEFYPCKPDIFWKTYREVV